MRTKALPKPKGLPTPRELQAAMRKGRCVTSNNWCTTHESSVLIHDGGRVACAHAWKRLAS